MELKTIAITSLKPFQRNPRAHPDSAIKKLVKSIETYGWTNPILVNKDMTVVGGHQRLKVLADAGHDKVPCSIVDLDKTKEMALNVALNKITGEWDFPKLNDLLIELDTGGFDMETVGYSEDELKDLLGYVPGDNKDIDEDAMKDTENECPSCGFKW